MHNKRTLLFLALAWTAAITVLSLITLGDVGGSVRIPYKDKMLHFVFYFVFMLVWFRYKSTGSYNKKTSIAIFITAVAYGTLMEACQHFFTIARTADIYDILANTAGALSGLLVIRYNFLNKTQL